MPSYIFVSTADAFVLRGASGLLKLVRWHHCIMEANAYAPIYRLNPFITREGNGRAATNAYIAGGALGKDGKPLDMGSDIFARGLCLPSDNKMTPEQQDRVIEVVRACFE